MTVDNGAPMGPDQPVDPMAQIIALMQGNGESPEDAAAKQALFAALHGQVQSAQQDASQAGQQYTDAASAPPPANNPFAELAGNLLPKVASIVSRDPSYAKQGHQDLQDQHTELMQRRVQTLKSLADQYSQKADAAEKLGNLEAQQKFKELEDKALRENMRILADMKGIYANKAVDTRTQSAEDIAAANNASRERQTEAMAAARRFAALHGGSGAASSPDIIKTLADGMQNGTLPTEFNNLGRGGAAALVKAELVRRGVDVTQKSAQWKAEQRAISTLRGPQQLRMIQSLKNVRSSLTRATQLNDELSNVIPDNMRTQFPEVNSFTLGLAKGGKFGPEAQKAATNLQSQITLLGTEIGNVTMGGNSPTDQAVRHARDILNSTWSQEQLQSALSLANDNIEYRQNAINQSEQEQAPHMTPDAAPVDPTIRGQAMKAARTGDTAALRKLVKDNPALDDDPELNKLFDSMTGTK